MRAAIVVLAVAAALHLLRYLLLMWNRTVLLEPWLAGAGTWLPLAFNVLAGFAVAAVAIVATEWLVARRSAAFAARGARDPRPIWRIRLMCLLPLANLLWAPTLLTELAEVERRRERLGRRLAGWWVVWTLSYLAALWATLTSRPTDVQGIADNTEIAVLAFLLALLTVVLADRLVEQFERAPVERAPQRWLMVPADAERDADAERGVATTDGDEGDRPRKARPAVEQRQPEPAA